MHLFDLTVAPWADIEGKRYLARPGYYNSILEKNAEAEAGGKRLRGLLLVDLFEPYQGTLYFDVNQQFAMQICVHCGQLHLPMGPASQCCNKPLRPAAIGDALRHALRILCCASHIDWVIVTEWTSNLDAAFAHPATDHCVREGVPHQVVQGYCRRCGQIEHVRATLMVRANESSILESRLTVAVPHADQFENLGLHVDPVMGPLKFAHLPQAEKLVWVLATGDTRSIPEHSHHAPMKNVKYLRDQCRALDIPFCFVSCGQSVECPLELAHKLVFADPYSEHKVKDLTPTQIAEYVSQGAVPVHIIETKFTGNLVDDERYDAVPEFLRQ